MALTVKTTRKRRGTWELKEGLTVRVRDTEWHLTARAGSWGQRSPLWWSGWCYSGPDPWKRKKGRGDWEKVKSFSFHSCFQTLFFKSQLTAESVNRDLNTKVPGSASTAPTRTRCPRGNAAQSWRLSGSISAMLWNTESQRPTLPRIHCAVGDLPFSMLLLCCSLRSKRSHTHAFMHGSGSCQRTPALFCSACTKTLYKCNYLLMCLTGSKSLSRKVYLLNSHNLQRLRAVILGMQHWVPSSWLGKPWNLKNCWLYSHLNTIFKTRNKIWRELCHKCFLCLNSV